MLIILSIITSLLSIMIIKQINKKYANDEIKKNIAKRNFFILIFLLSIPIGLLFGSVLSEDAISNNDFFNPSSKHWNFFLYGISIFIRFAQMSSMLTLMYGLKSLYKYKSLKKDSEHRSLNSKRPSLIISLIPIVIVSIFFIIFLAITYIDFYGDSRRHIMNSYDDGPNIIIGAFLYMFLFITLPLNGFVEMLLDGHVYVHLYFLIVDFFILLPIFYIFKDFSKKRN